jgi:hypothetical protein
MQAIITTKHERRILDKALSALDRSALSDYERERYDSLVRKLNKAEQDDERDAYEREVPLRPIREERSRRLLAYYEQTRRTA